MSRPHDEPESEPDDADLDEGDWNPDPATVPCPECGGDVSEEADRCPRCGHYISPADARSARPWWIKASVAFLIGLMIWALVAWW